MYNDIFVGACNLLTNLSTLSDWSMYRDSLKPTYWLAKQGGVTFDEDTQLYAEKFITKYEEIDARYNNRA